MEISVEYEILLSAKVDVETGEVVSVTAFAQEFNTGVPLQVYTGDQPDLPEYLPVGHPVRNKAEEIVSRIIVNNDLEVGYQERAV